MPPPAQIRSSMATILPLIESRLRLVTGLPAERVLPWVGDESPPHLQGDHDLVLRLQGITPDRDWQGGGGRVTLRVTERLEVQLRTRLALDPSGTAREWLVNQTYGHIALRDAVLDSLTGYHPTDASGNSLVTDPLVLVPSRPPRQDGTRAQPLDWGSEVLTFEVSYLQDLDQALSAITVEEAE